MSASPEKWAEIERSFGDARRRVDVSQQLRPIRDGAMQLARIILEHTPGSREQSLAITRLQEALGWAREALEQSKAP